MEDLRPGLCLIKPKKANKKPKFTSNGSSKATGNFHHILSPIFARRYRRIRKTPILDLPDEVITMILENISVSNIHEHSYCSPRDASNLIDIEAQWTLVSVCKVSRRMYLIAMPILYKALIQKGSFSAMSNATWANDHSTVGTLRQPHYSSLSLILRTLLDRPHMARNIDTFIIGAWSMDRSALRYILTREMQVSSDGYMNVVRKIAKMDTIKELKPMLLRNCVDDDGALAILLLLASSSIKDLRFEIKAPAKAEVFAPDSLFLDILTASVLPNYPEVPCFNNLRTITVDLSTPAYEERADERIERLALLFRLPALRVFTMFNWIEDARRSTFAIPPNVSTVRELRFHDCRCPNASGSSAMLRVVEAMVRGCAKLETFIFTKSMAEDQPTPSGKSIFAILYYQRFHLRSIVLQHYHHLDPPSKVLSRPPPGEHGWNKFIALQHLSISEMALLGTDLEDPIEPQYMFPHNLETLTLALGQSTLIRYFCAHLPTMSKRLPKLRLIKATIDPEYSCGCYSDEVQSWFEIPDTFDLPDFEAIPDKRVQRSAKGRFMRAGDLEFRWIRLDPSVDESD